MAKRPTSRSQADDTAAARPAPPKPGGARAPKASASTPPGAPVPSDTQAARAHATDQRPIDLDPGRRPESLDALTSGSTSMASEPSEHDIRMRAYHRYLERGGEHGLAFDDWVEAERELKTRT
ncbi:MAG: hypothetical protein AUH43_25365 [Acidobacteria bacterium 13_1_40CM_65_14]|nr:MAG: hypothetical protein AUH43_25365 [Acidobacteria bacterium 13_1_40CM_65_14]